MPGQASKPGGVRSCRTDEGGLRLVLNNSLDAIDEGRLALLDFLRPHALDDRVINRLEVIFEELVSNTVRHGFAPKSDQSVQVQAAARGEQLELVFEDDGTPFDPLQAEAPAPFQSLEAARLGGLGIPLAIKLSSSVSYERPSPAPERSAPAGGFAPTNRLRVTISTRA
jgi:anti-sigma regulatory factor (Ser/Thr protein kinase)